MKKRFISTLLAASLASLMLAACGSTDTAGQKSPADTAASDLSSDLLDEIKDRGYITVAMEGNWAPWTYHDETDKLVGFDVEVSKAVADKLGVEVRYTEGEWDGLLAGVQSGRYDLMVNGVGYSEERAQAYEFTKPYAFNKTVLVVRSDNEEIKSLEDLKGKTTCNSANSTYQIIAEKYGASVKDVETLAGTMDEVLAGSQRADATLNAEVSFHDYMNEHPDAPLKAVDYYPESEQVCIIMPKGEKSYTLRDEIDGIIDELRADGTLSDLSNKYFGLDITKE